jgi:hypothetical protein
MALLNDSLKAYRALLKKEMAAAQWYQIPVWAPMIGHIGGTDGKYPRSVPFGATKARTLKPTGKPIEVLTDFYHGGGITMDIPIAYPLTEVPIYGDNPALGNEEHRKWAYAAAIINQLRKPVLTRDGMMGELALTPKMVAQIMENAKDELIDFNKRWQAYAPYDALTRGYSQNILASQIAGGFGNTLSQKSHPNFFVAGYGQVPWSSTAATYETNVQTALNSLANNDTCKFTTRTIKNAKVYASQLRIQPTQIGGETCHVMIINEAQAVQLFDDEEFKSTMRPLAANSQVGDKSPLFTGVVGAYLYLGVLILVDTNAPGVWTTGDTSYNSSYGTINYGNPNPLSNPIMNSDRKIAFLIGQSAVMCGMARSLSFASETWDYENKKSEASNTTVGYNRSDITDNDGMFGTAGLFKENTSSLQVATYSPNSPSW